MRLNSVRIIIAANIAVFLLWMIFGLPSFMSDNFLSSWNYLAEGRVWTLVTSVFSHYSFWHLFFNMFVLNSFGTVMAIVLGKRGFLFLYFTAGIVATLAHAVVSRWLIGEPDLPVLGASGAISAIILVFALLFPKYKILLFGIIPVPALVGALLFIGLDVWGLMAQARGGGLPIGHGAHLGGAFTGILYYLLVIRKNAWHYRARLY